MSFLLHTMPFIGTVQPEDIPELVSTKSNGGNVRTRYIAGWKSAAFLDRSNDFTIIDVEMPVNTKHKLHIPLQLSETILVYAYRGNDGTVNLMKLKPQYVAQLIVDEEMKKKKNREGHCSTNNEKDGAYNDNNSHTPSVVIELE